MSWGPAGCSERGLPVSSMAPGEGLSGLHTRASVLPYWTASTQQSQGRGGSAERYRQGQHSLLLRDHDRSLASSARVQGRLVLWKTPNTKRDGWEGSAGPLLAVLARGPEPSSVWGEGKQTAGPLETVSQCGIAVALTDLVSGKVEAQVMLEGVCGFHRRLLHLCI